MAAKYDWQGRTTELDARFQHAADIYDPLEQVALNGCPGQSAYRLGERRRVNGHANEEDNIKGARGNKLHRWLKAKQVFVT